MVGSGLNFPGARGGFYKERSARRCPLPPAGSATGRHMRRLKLQDASMIFADATRDTRMQRRVYLKDDPLILFRPVAVAASLRWVQAAISNPKPSSPRHFRSCAIRL